MAEFACQLQIPDQPGLEPNDLTVGRVFTLECTGPWPEGADPANFRWQPPKEPPKTEAAGPATPGQGAPAKVSPYHLKILKGEAVSKDTVRFEATSYVAGQGSIPLVFTDGKREISAGTLELQVRSVLDPQQPKQEPYGPFGPQLMGIPASWWLMLAIVLAAVGAFAFWRVRRRVQRRNLMKRLKEHESAQSPITEFYSRMRRLRREKAFFGGLESSPEDVTEAARELEAIFRLYFMRKFQLPALDWGDGTLLRTFRSERKAVWRETGDDLKKLLKEFAAARSANSIEAKDVVQTAESTRRLTEKFERLKGGA